MSSSFKETKDEQLPRDSGKHWKRIPDDYKINSGDKGGKSKLKRVELLLTFRSFVVTARSVRLTHAPIDSEMLEIWLSEVSRWTNRVRFPIEAGSSLIRFWSIQSSLKLVRDPTTSGTSCMSF